MRVVGQLSFLAFCIVTFMLICVIAFAGDAFSERHNWRHLQRRSAATDRTEHVFRQIDLGRLFCLWLLRLWLLLFVIVVFYFFGGKYVA